MNSNFTDKEIICGRGQGVQRLPGNVMFRKIVKAHKQIYARAPDADKQKISKGVVIALRHFGFKFLNFDTSTNEKCVREIGNKKAVEKTSQALREKRKKMGDSSNPFVTSSNTSTATEESCFNHAKQLLQSWHSLSEQQLSDIAVAQFELKELLSPPSFWWRFDRYPSGKND